MILASALQWVPLYTQFVACWQVRYNTHLSLSTSYQMPLKLTHAWYAMRTYIYHRVCFNLRIMM